MVTAAKRRIDRAIFYRNSESPGSVHTAAMTHFEDHHIINKFNLGTVQHWPTAMFVDLDRAGYRDYNNKFCKMCGCQWVVQGIWMTPHDANEPLRQAVLHKYPRVPIPHHLIDSDPSSVATTIKRGDARRRQLHDVFLRSLNVVWIDTDTLPTPTLPDLNHISRSMATSPTQGAVGNRTNRWPPRDLRHDVPTTAHITAEDLASARLDDGNADDRLRCINDDNATDGSLSPPGFEHEEIGWNANGVGDAFEAQFGNDDVDVPSATTVDMATEMEFDGIFREGDHAPLVDTSTQYAHPLPHLNDNDDTNVDDQGHRGGNIRVCPAWHSHP
jgi:hypothetical protein